MYYNGSMQLILIDDKRNLFLEINSLEFIKAIVPSFDGDNVSWRQGIYLGHIKTYLVGCKSP